MDAVVFHIGDRRVEGWALNVSQGGLRAIVEQPLEPGDEVEVAVGAGGVPRPARVVWVRPERDGAIVGVAFGDGIGSVPPDDDSAADQE